ncbi:hypothetical protein BTW10_13085 [Chromohalobacter japonicus]|uniref:DNA-binding protein n=1 Tax=Chromohalobacter japonicus TaxID=223900 RepID=A0A1Q8TAE1_9GAMM|nr:hypothetical protein BTW10_13085 [Chromohalobacter japonicus]
MHLYTLHDISKAYAIGRDTAANWASQATFPAPFATYGVRKRQLFKPAEVHSWVINHRPAYAAKGVSQ